MNTKHLLIALAIIAIAIAGYFGFKKNTTETKALSYTSEFISFSYPEEFIVLETETATSSTSILVKAMVLMLKSDYEGIANGSRTDGDGPEAMTIQVLRNTENLSPNAWVEKNPELSNATLKTNEVKETAVANFPAVTYTADGLYRNSYVIGAKSDKIYFLSAAYLDEDSLTYKYFPDILRTIQVP